MNEQNLQAGDEIVDIPLSELFESPWNPRQHYPEAALAELAESMRASGFRRWLPLMVRPREEGGYEIGAGHRRRRAAEMAELAAAPCIVRRMSDVEFLDVLNFDNTGREDVHPLHEAAGWAAWMEKTGNGVNDIAVRIGQSREYVYQRLKYSALIELARNAFLDGDITAGHAILIARLQPNDQKKALKFMAPESWAPERKKSVRELGAFIQRDIHLDMARATFDLTSESLLPQAGPCTVCLKRTLNAPDLIVDRVARVLDLEEGEEIDECTDMSCFNTKVSAHLVQVQNRLAEEGYKAIKVSSAYGGAKKGLINRMQYTEVEPGSPESTAAIIADGYDVGKVIHIKVKAAAVADDEDDVPGQDARQRKEEEESKQAIAREKSVRLAILKAIREKAGASLGKWEIAELIAMLIRDNSIAGAAALCGLHGIEVPPAANRWEDEDDRASEALDKALPSLSAMEMNRLVLELPITDELDNVSLHRKDPPVKLLELARSYRVDAAKIRAELEGGTRREVQPDPAEKKKTPAAKKKAVAKKPAPKKAAAKKAVAKKAKPAKAAKTK